MIKIGEQSAPSALQTEILMRAYKEKELLAIVETYKAARKQQRFEATKPTDKQYAIAKDMRTMDTREVAKKYKIEKNQAYQSRNRVSVWEYMNQ